MGLEIAPVSTAVGGVQKQDTAKRKAARTFGALCLRWHVLTDERIPADDGPERHAPGVVAYVLSRFPKITETFILYEILELRRQGTPVKVFSLVRESSPLQHPEAQPLVHDAVYGRLSPGLLMAQLHWIRRRPGRYLRAWWRAVRGTIRSPRFLARALITVPIAAAFAREMERAGIAHIHAHWATHPTLAANVAAHLLGIGYSFTAHAHDIYVERTMLAEKIEASRFVVTISDYNRRLLTRVSPRSADKVVVIHCGVDLKAFQPSHLREPSGTWTVVSVASLQPQKGHRYLVDACRILRSRGIDLRCLIVGEGTERGALLEAISAAGLDDRVRLLGALSRPDVIATLAAADAVALASVRLPSGKMEGIPVALMEAMAMERPVVATAISGIPELVSEEVTGLLVPERDPAALADALDRLRSHRELAARLARAGRERVEQEFDLGRNTARLAELFTANAK